MGFIQVVLVSLPMGRFGEERLKNLEFKELCELYEPLFLLDPIVIAQLLTAKIRPADTVLFV